MISRSSTLAQVAFLPTLSGSSSTLVRRQPKPGRSVHERLGFVGIWSACSYRMTAGDEGGQRSDQVADEPFRLLTARGFLARAAVRLGFDARLPTGAERTARLASYLFITWVAPMALAFVSPARPGIVSFMADFETHLRSLIAI